MIRKCSAALLSLGLTFVLTTGCGSIASSPDSDTTISKKVTVEAQEAGVGNMEIASTYIAVLDPINSVAVTPLVSGVVKSVKVEVGDTVKKGQVLCKFDDEGAALSVKSAEDAVSSARAGKNAAQTQQDAAQAQSDATISTMKQTLKEYKSSLKKAKKQLKEAKIAKRKLLEGAEQARKAYETTNTQYKKAEVLYLNYKAFLEANPDCRTTAGLTAAATQSGTLPGTPAQTPDSGSAADGTGQGTDSSQSAADGTSQDPAPEKPADDVSAGAKQQMAAQLLNALNEAGLTVEYLSRSGLKILQENVEETKALYTNASAGKGQMDASIGTLESTVEQLRSQVELTQANIKASRKAADAALAGTGVYDAQIRAAETGVESARYQQSLYTITSPISGIIESVNVTRDEMAPMGVPAFTISQKKTMEASFYVTEEVKNYLKIGDAVRTEADENGLFSKGRIIGIDTAVDPQKGLFRIKAEIRPADRSAYSSGTSINLIVISNSARNQILIPYDAVYYENGQAYVFVIQNGVAVRTNVTTGLYDSEKIVITAGLNPGDQIVTSWASGLKDGAEVEIRKSGQSTQTSDDTTGMDSRN